MHSRDGAAEVPQRFMVNVATLYQLIFDMHGRHFSNILLGCELGEMFLQALIEV